MAEKKNKVDYAAIIREYLTYHNGESLKHFCDEGGYHYASVQRYYRRAFWDSKSKDYAFMFSMIESCKMNDLPFGVYLRCLIPAMQQEGTDKTALLPCFYTQK